MKPSTRMCMMGGNFVANSSSGGGGGGGGGGWGRVDITNTQSFRHAVKILEDTLLGTAVFLFKG